MARAKKQPAAATKRTRVADANAERARTESLTVTFTGDPRGGRDPDIAEYGGKHFPKGKPVTVDEHWLALNANIRRNNHFTVR